MRNRKEPVRNFERRLRRHKLYFGWTSFYPLSSLAKDIQGFLASLLPSSRAALHQFNRLPRYLCALSSIRRPDYKYIYAGFKRLIYLKSRLTQTPGSEVEIKVMDEVLWPWERSLTNCSRRLRTSRSSFMSF
jgi:hypothetical protein